MALRLYRIGRLLLTCIASAGRRIAQGVRKLTSILLFTHFRYLTLYVALIPAFGCLYYLTQDSLFAPYARYEPSARNDERQLARIIESALRTSYEANRPPGSWGNFIDTSTIHVDEIVDDGKRIEFNLSFSSSAPYVVRVRWPEALHIDPNRGFSFSSNGTTRYYAHLVEVRNTKGGFGTFPYIDASPGWLFSCPGLKRSEQVICLNVDDDERLRDYARGLRGYASRFSHPFRRSVYFSAITITGVGYGDVVPIRSLSRMMAALEAILGVVLVGLFINEAATRPHSSRRSR